MLTWQGTLASLLNFFWSTAGGLRCPALPSRATRGKIILGGIQNLVGGRAGGGVCFSFLTWGKERERAREILAQAASGSRPQPSDRRGPRTWCEERRDCVRAIDLSVKSASLRDLELGVLPADIVKVGARG